jgi:glycosyltransferase involved in cell wall biosynthesis
LVELVERPHGAPIDHIYEDLDLGRRATRDARLVRSVTEHVQRAAAEVIVLEQPYLADLTAEVAAASGTPVVYSSANIEYRLKRDLERFQPDWKRPTTRSEDLRALEQRAVDLASCVTAICRTDQQALREEFGCEATLVPNGTSIADLRAPRQAPLHDPVDFAVAGSAYWPNVEGLAKIATPSLAFLPPTARIHVAGSMSSQVLTEPSIARHYSVNASRLILRGFLNMNELVATMQAARAVLVPIFTGEGSNLKSADALACGRPVIMTRRATRGYEDVIEIDPEGISVVEDARDFREAMRVAFESRPTFEVGAQRSGKLSWKTRLAPLVDLVAHSCA